MASGELSQEEYQKFLTTALRAVEI